MLKNLMEIITTSKQDADDVFFRVILNVDLFSDGVLLHGVYHYIRGLHFFINNL